MAVFEAIGTAGHEEVLFGNDPVSGLNTIIAIHSTTLGPALGGTRFYPYASEDEALVDVLRLSSTMTFKAAAAGVDLGGGKAVIIGDPAAKTERMIRAYGRVGAKAVSVEDIHDVECDVFAPCVNLAGAENISTHRAAVKVAEQRIANIGGLRLKRRGEEGRVGENLG